MKIRIMICSALACAIAMPAAAQTTSLRTFVSGLGNDTATCQRTTPCRSFAHAIGQTAASGEIVALDPAGYGPVMITKAISLIGPPGGYASITQSAGNDIMINASGAAVVLRGLDVVGSTNDAISIAAAGSVTIDRSLITGNGSHTAINSFAASTSLTVTHTVISNFGDGYSGSSVLVAKDVNVSATGAGFLIAGGRASLDRCIVTGASGNGISVNSGATAFVKGSVVANSVTAFLVRGTLSLDTTTTFGISNDAVLNQGGTVNSYGNNNIVGATQGTITRVTPN